MKGSFTTAWCLSHIYTLCSIYKRVQAAFKMTTFIQSKQKGGKKTPSKTQIAQSLYEAGGTKQENG